MIRSSGYYFVVACCGVDDLCLADGKLSVSPSPAGGKNIKLIEGYLSGVPVSYFTKLTNCVTIVDIEHVVLVRCVSADLPLPLWSCLGEFAFLVNNEGDLYEIMEKR